MSGYHNGDAREAMVEAIAPGELEAMPVDAGDFERLKQELGWGTLGPDQIGEMIADLCQRIDAEVESLKAICLEAAEAETAYKKAKALAYIKAESETISYQATDSKQNLVTKVEKKTVPRIEAEVAIACETERERAYLARNAKDAATKMIDAMRNQLMALQTIAKGVSDQINISRYNGATRQ